MHSENLLRTVEPKMFGLNSNRHLVITVQSSRHTFSGGKRNPRTRKTRIVIALVRRQSSQTFVFNPYLFLAA